MKVSYHSIFCVIFIVFINLKKILLISCNTDPFHTQQQIEYDLDINNIDGRPMFLTSRIETDSQIAGNILLSQHEKEWEILYESGIDIWPYPNNTESDDEIIGLNGIGMNFNTANSIAGHVNSSLYYLLSSIRSDWNHGASPGGIATGMYSGAVFFDMDFYITPAFLLLNPNISKSNLQYRYDSINTSLSIAKIFGYNGAMYPFPSAYHGYPTSCCNGTGGKETCYEQHITPDIAVISWYYYLSTGNITWLKNRGYPILSNISNWVISRVTPKPNINDKNNTKYNINSVIPVDEWCVGSGCECANASVDNDVQMNAVAKLSLKYTVEAAKILNIDNSDITLYEKVYPNIRILFNDTYNRHNQFNSVACPNGFGAKHYTDPGHTVCPEDILYLSYPLNPDELNISSTIIKNDYDFFVPYTCQENAGMTTPIHTIVQTMLISQGIGNINFMENEFNRSMYGACYGSYNIRNEIDKHRDIIVHGSHEYDLDLHFFYVYFCKLFLLFY